MGERRIGRRLDARIEALRADPSVPAVVVDAALLLETDWQTQCTDFVFVRAPAEARAGRVRQKRGWDHATWKQVALSTAIALLVAVLIAQWMGLVIFGAVVLTVWLIARFTMQRIPGLTGDIYGAICEVIELVVLLLFIVKWPLI